MAKEPKLLAGGNPQIPKGYGDGPVQDYIEAMPEWKRDVGRRLDELVVRALPSVRKAVKYNSPLYGAEGREDWFLSYHCFDRYVKVAFFNGASLDGVSGLRKEIVKRPEVFIGVMTEKLMTYAVGRGLEYYDMPAVRKVVQGARATDYRFSSIVLGIVQSAPFRMKETR